MLYLFYGEADGQKNSPQTYFDYFYNQEWLKDPQVISMIKDITGDTVISPMCIHSKLFDMTVPPEKLAGGLKALIVLKYTNLVIRGSSLGENCFPWLLKLAEDKDIFVPVNYVMEPDYIDEPFEFVFMNNSSIVTTKDQYLDALLESEDGLRLEGPEDAMQEYYISAYKRNSLRFKHQF